MAVVSTVGCAGNIRLRRYDSSNVFNFQCRCAVPSCSLMVSNPQSSKQKTSKILATASFSEAGLRSLPKQAERGFPYDKVDHWVRDSVAEIVKKLPESPLFVRVYSDHANKTTRTTAEKAEEDNWVSMEQKGKKGESSMPDGVIFVEQIRGGGDKSGEASTSRVWGILVQGKGDGGPPACYVLKTSKVGSGFGLNCTHFCLAKVSSFSETAFSQLKNCWLVQ
ncbi:Detected protein of unknown function [Hibiscus syriacus]|uniref:DUF7804 domain-containing protein n=1 Tax=Hibiscus syriacus TaxID=106335 RepID=A0A6A2Z047_HIBSY|nr:Detected protein of unknown function [Hibiscus syriacus]